jgi:hypothetical protein
VNQDFELIFWVILGIFSQYIQKVVLVCIGLVWFLFRKVKNYASVKIGKPKTNTIASLVANTSWYVVCTSCVCKFIGIRIYFENTVSEREVKKW